MVEGSRGRELGRAVRREELQHGLVRQRVVHRVLQERVQHGDHDDEEEAFQVAPDQHADQQAERGVGGGRQHERDRYGPQARWAPEEQHDDRGVGADGDGLDQGAAGLGGDQGGRPVPGQHQAPVEGPCAADRSEHHEPGDQGDRAEPGGDQREVVAVHDHGGAGGAQPERDAGVRDHRADHEIPDRDEGDEQDPGEPVPDLPGQAEPDGGVKLLPHGRPPPRRSARRSGGRSGRNVRARRPGG